MSDFLKNLSAYDILNILIPGAIVVMATDAFGLTSLFAGNGVVAAVACFVFGVAASRVGSLVLEPLILKTKLLTRAGYEDYVSALDADDDIERLVTVANMYRSLAAALLLVIVAWACSLLPECFHGGLEVVSLALMLALFVAAWVKQDRYASKRVRVRVSNAPESAADESQVRGDIATVDPGVHSDAGCRAVNNVERRIRP